ncbi:MAG: MBL fold metallo-hydrolase [Candidatus Hydrogenedentes bacterium]|nr:MBL fold metallo-hydrolase [Candidatus Hydrogenedentota bacterium]
MPGQFEIVTLVDNTAAVPGLAAEHGLSFHIAANGRRVLFDTGAGGALAGNAAALGIDLDRTDAVVLSHGHYDHSGGAPLLFGRGAPPAFFTHPDSARPRYRRLDAPPHKPIGMPAPAAECLAGMVADITRTTGPELVAEGVWVTGPIPRRTPYEDTGGPFFWDPECTVPDSFPDDQAVWLEAPGGIVVLLGCAHSGVVNTLDYIAELTGARSFQAVIGGMHLANASQERLEATLDTLRRYRPGLVAPCHCTGERATRLMAEAFPGQFRRTGAGSRFAGL